MQSPKVSVIIPVYNIGPYLPQCLNSLINQTLSEIEVLCVDDASTDGSAQIVKAFQEKEPRIQLLQQPHQGVSAARNLGIIHARGEYIAFVDGDDWIEENMLEAMLAKAEQTACDMVVCSAEVHFEHQDVRSLRRHRSLQAALTVADSIWGADGTVSGVWSAVKLPGSWPFVWNKLIRSDLIKENSICFSPTLSMGEDGVFLQLLFQYAKQVVFLPKPLYHYRYQRKSSAMEKSLQNEAVRFQQHTDVVAVTFCEFYERGLLEKNGSYLLQWMLSFLYSDFIRLPVANKQNTVVILQNLFRQYDLKAFSGSLSHVEQKRLQNMLTAPKACSKAKRIFDIVQTKVENRVIRIFSRK